MDEFYGGYNYTSNCDGSVVSAADNIVDVDEDDVLIIDGLTKRFRLPGWVLLRVLTIQANNLACGMDSRSQGIHRCHRLLRIVPGRRHERAVSGGRHPDAGARQSSQRDEGASAPFPQQA